jgi:hypothetical protein
MIMADYNILSNVKEYTGSGVFRMFGNNNEIAIDEFKADFIFYFSPANMVIKAANLEIDPLWFATKINRVKLEGYLNDGRQVNCNNFICTKLKMKNNKTSLIFLPFNSELKITRGRESSIIKRIKFPLCCFYEVENPYSFGKWKMSFERNESTPSKAKEIGKRWDIPYEGNYLVLEDSSGKEKEEKYIDLANTIINFLSLVSGDRIVFLRRIIESENCEIQIFREPLRPWCGLDWIIPENVGGFLMEALPTYISWNDKNKSKLEDTIYFLNTSSGGFADDRLERAFKAWETASGIDILKSSSKNPSAKEKFLAICKNADFDLVKKPLNFKRFKDIRDKVTHTGRMYCDWSKEVKILFDFQFALRLILLKILGYTGLITSSLNGYRTHESISEYFIPNL